VLRNTHFPAFAGLLITLSLSAASAAEGLVFSEGFEAGVDTTTKWASTSSKGYASSAIDSAVSHSGSNSLYQRGCDFYYAGCPYIYSRGNLSAGRSVRVDFWYNISYRNTQNSYVGLDLDPEYGGIGPGIIMIRDNTENGRIAMSFPGEGWFLGSASLGTAPTGWNKLSAVYTATPTCTTVEVLRNDQLIQSRSVAGDLGSLARLQIGCGGTGGDAKWYVDDISVTSLPEPAALSLLALGGLALTRRRRRK
jgi:MYXO-CTERM domain-containing protein